MALFKALKARIFSRLGATLVILSAAILEPSLAMGGSWQNGDADMCINHEPSIEQSHWVAGQQKLSFNGDAVGTFEKILLTQNAPQTSSAVWKNSVPLYTESLKSRSFSSAFSFKMSSAGGISDNASNYYVWVDYYSQLQRIEARLSEQNIRPKQSSLARNNIDLSTVLDNLNAFIGFASSINAAGGRHDIFEFELISATIAMNPCELVLSSTAPTDISLGQTLSYQTEMIGSTQSQSSANGQLAGALLNLAYTPNPDFIGNDNFTFRVNDGIGDNADAVGNVATAATTATREVPQTKVMSIISGQFQTANIQSTLDDPLVVRLMSDGQPVANQKVVFKVIQGNGIFPSTPNAGNSAVVTTDSKGEATISYQLGSRSGNGNHSVRASAVGYEGEVIFYATANAAAGVRIGIIEGNNQRGLVRQPLPKPFTVAVTDEGANLIPNASVTFTVTEGSGCFINDESTISVLTDNDGRASASYVLGPKQGIDVEHIIASLSTSSSTAGFIASAFIPGDPGNTIISGVVLDNQDEPVPDVTIRIEGSTRQAVSDAQGRFIITETPVGPVHLLVEGSTTSRSGEWPTLSYNTVTVRGVVNRLASPIYLVELDMKNAVTVGEVDTIVTHPELPDFALDVAAGSVTFPNGSKAGRITISRVNVNEVPMTPPNGIQPQLIIAIQPHGVTFDPPAPITVPNTDEIKPLSEIEMFIYDYDLQEFVTIGLGVVSKDGRTITSKSGSGVVKAGWTFPTTFKPEGERYFVGRDGVQFFEPGSGITGFLEDHVPVIHDMGIIHDVTVDVLTNRGTSDWLANAPTMLPTLIVSIWANSLGDGFLNSNGCE